jgi:hypothetical protein
VGEGLGNASVVSRIESELGYFFTFFYREFSCCKSLRGEGRGGLNLKSNLNEERGRCGLGCTSGGAALKLIHEKARSKKPGTQILRKWAQINLRMLWLVRCVARI